MPNSQENHSTTLPNLILQSDSDTKLYNLLHCINIVSPLRSQIHSILLILNFLIVLFIFLSLDTIALLPSVIQIQNNMEIVVLCLLVGIVIISVQFLIGIIYGKQIFLKGQFLVYRFVLFPIGFYLWMNGVNTYSIIQIFNKILAIFAIVAILLLQFVIGRESLANKLILDKDLPLTSYLFIFQLLLCLYSTQKQYRNLLQFLMIINVLYSKYGVINTKKRRSKCLEYILLKIIVGLNLMYTTFLIANEMCQVNIQHKQPYAFIFPLIIFIIMAQFLCQHSEHMKPITEQFFNKFKYFQHFLQCVQYVLDDQDIMTTNQNCAINTFCLVPIYYTHLQHCKLYNCKLSHELQANVFSSNGHYKQLCTTVSKIIQQIFQSFMQIQYQNIDLRLACLNFYTKTGQNKTKIIHLINQTQTFSLSWWEKMKIYSFKRFAAQIDSGEFIQNRKIENSFQNFDQHMSNLMRILIQFWTQFFQQRVDFQKVLQLVEKITPIINGIQAHVERALEVESFQTIHTMRNYADYIRWVMNDEMKSAMISDYISLLSKKMSKVNEINYISADVEIGIIAISLSVKQLGQIKVANAQAANIFNYNKEQLMKINVNQIMPTIFGQHHDQFLRAFIGNQHKKVNTDRRLLIGKKKQGYIFQIFLQLQKSIITTSQQLIFIANIELSKMYQSCIIIICDDKGLINDINSTYHQIFDKSVKKHKNQQVKKYVNIQELIPSFFEIVLSDSSTPKQSIQSYDNPTFGIIQIKYQIIKISLPLYPDPGYIVKGHRIHQLKQPFYQNISLTQSLTQLLHDDQLKGMKIRYNSSQNQYTFNENLDILSCGQFNSDITIPYFKLQYFSNILNDKYQNKIVNQYDADIKTIRYYGDHFERVQQPQPFQSQISQQQKTTINSNKFTMIMQKLENQQNCFQNKFPIFLSMIFMLLKVVILIGFYSGVMEQKQEIFRSTFNYVDTYGYRAKISEYILYFQFQNDPVYGQFFRKHKNILRQQLIDQITSANLPQSQKQKAYKIIYLQQTLKNTSFQQLINDQTLLLSTLKQTIAQYTKFITFRVLLAIIIILKFIMNFVILKWQQHKILNIFSLFLTLSQFDIKKQHKKCHELLKDTDNNMQKISSMAALSYQQDVQDSQQNLHVKNKRFKNITSNKSSFNYMKLNVFTIVLLCIFIGMEFYNMLIDKYVQNDTSIYQFISTVMPQYSTILMKTYSKIHKNISLDINQNFITKYQTIDYKLIHLLKKKQQFKIYQILYSNLCNNYNYDIPVSIKCQVICNKVMTDGISKSINYLAHNLQYFQQMLQNNKITATNKQQIQQQLTNLAILLYHLVKPNLNEIQQSIKSQVQNQQHITRISIILYFILFLFVTVCDIVYLYYYPLSQIEKNINNSKILINLIPDVKKKSKNGYTQI